MEKTSSAVEGKMFLRNATGLRREVSLLDAFIMNTFGMNIAVGAVFLFLQAPAFFPNGNMLVAVIIGTLLMAFTLLWVYSTFAAPIALTTIGSVTGQSGWINLSSNLLASFPILGITTQWWVLIIGLLINIGFAALLILGGQSFWRWQKVFFLFAGGSIILAFLLLLFGGGRIPGAWDSFAIQ